MRQFLIMSHGHMSYGMLSTVSMLAGNNFNIDFLCAYVDGEDTDIKYKLEEYLSKLDINDEFIIFTDIFGDSVNNQAMNFLNDSRVKLISGVNLPLVIEVLQNSQDNSISIDEIIREAISASRESIVFCNDLDKDLSNDDF